RRHPASAPGRSLGLEIVIPYRAVVPCFSLRFRRAPTMTQATPMKKQRRNRLVARKETERNVPGGIDSAAGASGRGATIPNRIRRTPSGTRMDFFGADDIHIQKPERTMRGKCRFSVIRAGPKMGRPPEQHIEQQAR